MLRPAIFRSLLLASRKGGPNQHRAGLVHPFSFNRSSRGRLTFAVGAGATLVAAASAGLYLSTGGGSKENLWPQLPWVASRTPATKAILDDILLRANVESYAYEEEGSANTGIARVDRGFLQRSDDTARSVQMSSQTFPLPTHTMTFFTLVSSPVPELEETLRIAALSYLADLLSAYADKSTSLRVTEDPASVRPRPPSQEVDNALKTAFIMAEKMVYDKADGSLKAGRGEDEQENLGSDEVVPFKPGGSSAILAVYESDTRILRVTFTGDSRGILGRPGGDTSRSPDDNGHLLKASEPNTLYISLPLTAHHTPSTSVKAGPMKGPRQENHTLSNGRGSPSIEPNRKPTFVAKDSSPLSMPTNSPVYLTTNPEVTTLQIKPGDFLVLGNRGFFECLNDEDVVGFIGAWNKRGHRGRKHQLPKEWTPDNGNAEFNNLLPRNISNSSSSSSSFLGEHSFAAHVLRHASGGAAPTERLLPGEQSEMTGGNNDNIVAFQVVFFN